MGHGIVHVHKVRHDSKGFYLEEKEGRNLHNANRTAMEKRSRK